MQFPRAEQRRRAAADDADDRANHRHHDEEISKRRRAPFAEKSDGMGLIKESRQCAEQIRFQRGGAKIDPIRQTRVIGGAKGIQATRKIMRICWKFQRRRAICSHRTPSFVKFLPKLYRNGTDATVFCFLAFFLAMILSRREMGS